MYLFHKHTARPGTAPGSLEAPPERRVEEVRLEVVDYAPGHCEERRVTAVEELFPYRDRPGLAWINVVGLHDVELLRRLGEHYGLHPLALEDVLNTGHRPKHESHESHHFFVMKQIHLRPALVTEQVCLFFGPGWVLTFQEVAEDLFGGVRDRLRSGRVRIRGKGSDYLAYALIDALIDQFFPVLESYGERIEELEDELIEQPGDELLAEIHTVKRELLILRRVAWPLREVVNSFEREEPPLVQAETKVFLRDCYDHTIQIMDMLETYRDLASGLMDLYLSSVSNRMNEVMKVLTVMASIFIPLTFLAGIYGMNFDPGASPWNMPELGWRWGYPAFWAAIIALGGGLVWYFRRRGWL